MYGVRCIYNHEHRGMKQLHRHYYTPQMFILETLFEKSLSKQQFIAQYKPTTSTLPVFAKIHDELDDTADASTDSADELSEIDMASDMSCS